MIPGWQCRCCRWKTVSNCAVELPHPALHRRAAARLPVVFFIFAMANSFDRRGAGCPTLCCELILCLFRANPAVSGFSLGEGELPFVIGQTKATLLMRISCLCMYKCKLNKATLLCAGLTPLTRACTALGASAHMKIV